MELGNVLCWFTCQIVVAHVALLITTEQRMSFLSSYHTHTHSHTLDARTAVVCMASYYIYIVCQMNFSSEAGISLELIQQH